MISTPTDPEPGLDYVQIIPINPDIQNRSPYLSGLKMYRNSHVLIMHETDNFNTRKISDTITDYIKEFTSYQIIDVNPLSYIDTIITTHRLISDIYWKRDVFSDRTICINGNSNCIPGIAAMRDIFGFKQYQGFVFMDGGKNFNKIPFSPTTLSEELIDILTAFRNILHDSKFSNKEKEKGISYNEILKELSEKEYYTFEYDIDDNENGNNEWKKAKRWFNHHLKNLVESGIIKKEADPTDRRKMLLYEI